jgi:phosphohistidine phosphatase
MQRLILFRHAKTENRAASGADFDRALVERGRADAKRMGERLAAAGLAPDLVLLSTALRARETWACARDSFPRARIDIREGLYDATPEEVAAELEHGVAAADTVMVIGHNPSLQELAVNLLVDGGGSAMDIETLSSGFPTATAAVIALDGAGGARLEALLHPKDCAREQA